MEPNYIVAVPLCGGPYKGATVYLGPDDQLIFNPLAAIRYSETEANRLASKLRNGFVLEWSLSTE